MPTTMKKTCTHGDGFCPVHQGDCEIHNYHMGDGRCSCKPCPSKAKRAIPAHNPARLKGYYKEVYARLWKLRSVNPRWELVWQEGTAVDNPDYKPVVDGTMTILPDGTLAYLFDAGPPHPRDPRLPREEYRVKEITKCLQECKKEGGWKRVGREVLDLLRLMLSKAKSEVRGEPRDERYQELLFAVARKFPGETRHQTALRYIQEAEARATTGQVASAKVIGKLQKTSAKTTHSYRFPPPP